MQIWVDPKHPDAHRDPALRAYLERRAQDNIIGLVRWNDLDAIALFPPALSADRQWHEKDSSMRTKGHSVEEKIAVLGKMEIRFAPGGPGQAAGPRRALP